MKYNYKFWIGFTLGLLAVLTILGSCSEPEIIYINAEGKQIKITPNQTVKDGVVVEKTKTNFECKPVIVVYDGHRYIEFSCGRGWDSWVYSVVHHPECF
jgi:hypothetical protein